MYMYPSFKQITEKKNSDKLCDTLKSKYENVQ